MRSALRRHVVRLCAPAALVAVLLAPRSARAEADPFGAALATMVEAVLDLNFYSQLQGGLFAVSANDLRAGGVGARAAVNVFGLGGSLGGMVERYRAGTGGLALVDFEFRPLPFFKNNLYRVVDPFATAGMQLGGGDRGFHGAATLGAGVDLGLFGHPERNREVVQPVLSLRYQFRALQSPGDLPEHLLLVGAAMRLAF